MFPLGFVLDFFFLLFNLYKFKIVFIWFGDYHSYLPCVLSKITGKKSLLCLGGYDAHWIVPDKAYTLKDKFRKFCVMKSIKYASILLPVSNWLAGFIKPHKEEKNIGVAYCCVNPKALEGDLKVKKEQWILTVGGGGILYETTRKKLDFFIQIGNYFFENFPDYDTKFILIGHEKDKETYNYLINFVKSPNISILPPIEDTNILKEYFSKASVYCQFSEYEAFGIAVIEAMLNRTIPIVYNGGAMPEVIDGGGIIINNFDVENTANIIKDILDNKYEDLRDIARERVINNFTIEKRKEIIYKYI